MSMKTDLDNRIIWEPLVAPTRDKRVKKEIKYESKTVFIKPLNLRVKLHKGKTIIDWVKNYCKSHPYHCEKLYSFYNIPDVPVIHRNGHLVSPDKPL